MSIGSVHRESMSVIVQQAATIYNLLYFCKLLYKFRVVHPPIIKSTYNCVPSAVLEEMERSSNSSTIAEGSRNDLTCARCCNYSYVCSWWWVEVPPETCRAVFQKYNKLYIVASCWTIIDIVTICLWDAAIFDCTLCEVTKNC